MEKKSRFLRALLPIYPFCQDIHFGLIDCVTIGFALICFIGALCVLAG